MSTIELIIVDVFGLPLHGHSYPSLGTTHVGSPHHLHLDLGSHPYCARCSPHQISLEAPSSHYSEHGLI